MALKALLDSLDGLSEDVAKEYEEVTINGEKKFQVQVTPVGDLALGDVGKLQRTIQTTRKERDDLKTKLKPFRDESGDLLDPEVARSAITKLEELGDDAGSDEKIKAALEEKERQLVEKYESQSKKLVEKHDADVKAVTDRLTSARQQLQNAIVDQQAALALNKHGGNAKLLMPVVRQHAKMAQTEEGQFYAQILDETGQPRLSQRANSGTQEMDIDEFVETLKADDSFGAAFKASDASGGDQQSGRSRGAGGFTISQQEARNPATYRAARDAAEKAGQQLQVTE